MYHLSIGMTELLQAERRLNRHPLALSIKRLIAGHFGKSQANKRPFCNAFGHCNGKII
tara:strand:+ start:1080 stop:1253 length:174 start_codon:yes stop_codon:yes gene_type:complete